LIRTPETGSRAGGSRQAGAAVRGGRSAGVASARCLAAQADIYAICYRFTGSATDAEDLTQDVFLKLYRNLASFDVERGSFQTWITTLARNLLVDHFRRTRLERATDSLDASYGETTMRNAGRPVGRA